MALDNMSKNDKIKLGAAIAILLAAGLLIYFSLRETPAPQPPPSANTDAGGSGTAPPPKPVPGSRRSPTDYKK